LDIVKQTVEYQSFGWNALTIGATGGALILVFEIWALLKQVASIWRARSVKSLSAYWLGYIACYFAACIPYGLGVRGGLIIVTSALFVLAHIPLLWGIHRFRGFSALEIVSIGAFALMVPAMIQFPSWSDALYLAFSMGTVYAFVMQAWELWKTKETGALNLELLVTYLVATAFWTVYAFAIDALALKILNPALLVILSATIAMWIRFKAQETNPATV